MLTQYRYLQIDDSIHQRLDQSKFTMLIGENGSGKTNVLEYLCEHYEKEHKVIYFRADRFFSLSKEQIDQSFLLGSLIDSNFFEKYGVKRELIHCDKLHGQYIGSGLLQIVHIFANIILELDDVIVLIDEPERHLDMDNQRNLISDILEIRNVKKLICASHSPFIGSDQLSNMLDVSQYVDC